MPSIWIHSPNPLGLKKPSAEWQRALSDFDKMLRIFPSQKDRLYRLARVVRREAALGLSSVVVHTHPDTVTMIQHGIVPVTSILPWAVEQNRSDQVLAWLKMSDTWSFRGGDPHKWVDALEAAEAEKEAAIQREADAEFDEIASRSYKDLRYGKRVFLHLRPDVPPRLREAKRQTYFDETLDAHLADHPRLPLSSSPADTASADGSQASAIGNSADPPPALPPPPRVTEW